jgi:uncharacterized membrane protein
MDVLYVGDDKLKSDQFFAGAENVQVFQRRIKDYEPLLEALEESPEVSVQHMGGPETIASFPESLDELCDYDALIVSDLSRGTLTPHFYPGAIPGPNKLRIVREFVESGGGLLYCGGWMTFQGYKGAGNWQGTPVETVLPVEIRPVFDDRVERPEGAETTVHDPDHPVFDGVDAGSFPPVYGYNRVGPVGADAEEHATVAGDTLIATGAFGDGRTFVYTSDPNVKWGLDLVEWDHYRRFWVRTLQWATRER